MTVIPCIVPAIVIAIILNTSVTIAVVQIPGRTLTIVSAVIPTITATIIVHVASSFTWHTYVRFSYIITLEHTFVNSKSNNCLQDYRSVLNQ